MDQLGEPMQTRVLFLVTLLLLAPALQIIDVAEATNGRALGCSGTICLNEGLPNPNGYDDAAWPGGEWMEIFNSGTSAVDVLSWTLENKASKTLTFDSSSIVGFETGNSSTWTIQPGDYMVIARNASQNFYLTNTFDYITMRDSSSNIMDQASWNNTASGVSLEEDPSSSTADWISTNSPTPGAANNAATGPVVSDLKMSEVMANPWPSEDNATWPGGEWVEIWNAGNSTMNLTGWTIVDSAGNILPFNESHLIGSSMDILVDERRTIAVNGSFQWGFLNNGAETIRLLWPNGTTSQTLSWSSTIPGFAMVDNGAANMEIAAFPSPETTNPMPWDLIVNGTSPIQITEVLSNATTDGAPLPDGQWLELHNSGNGDLDLQGWLILDGMGNITNLDMQILDINSSQPGTTISADGRRLVQFIGDTILLGQYDQLMLVNQFGEIVSSAWWSQDYGVNVSLIQSANPMDAWTPAPWPTPGHPNPGTVVISGDIEFNEIMPDAVGNDSSDWPNGEWLEIINIGNGTVDIANWHFTAGSRNLNIYPHNMPFKDDTILQPGEIALVAVNGSSGFYMLNTNPDIIELRDGSNNIISNIQWNDSTEGESVWNWNGDWSQAPWPTPGQPNPTTSPYIGTNEIAITEILAHCPDDSITPVSDWVEVLNNGTEMIDLAGWRLISDDGDLFHARVDSIWNSTSTVIAPGERFVITMPNWFISGLGGGVFLENPDGIGVDDVTWDITTECQTMDGEGQVLAWPTPGAPEPDPSSYAGPDDLIFSRFMFEERSNASNDEFFEITNTGSLPALLSGWKIVKVSTGGSTFDGTFISGIILAGESVIISPDADSVKGAGEITVLDADDVMDFPVWLSNYGSGIQLVSPEGIVADAFTYGNGPANIEGWSGVSISEPVTTIDRILYLRGDGCGDMPDTDTATDWEIRWSTAGASHFCGINTFSDNSAVIPLVGPDNGLAELVEWIDDAEQSIHVHVYQFHHPVLAQALIDAQASGVEVTVVVHEPESWWDDYTVGQSLGIMYELDNAGIEVLQFSSSSSSPYQYLHSKVAVKDTDSVWIGSGNWKTSSLPTDGSGNRDWSVIVDSSDLANIVLERMAFDEEPSELHIEDPTINQPESGSYTPPYSIVTNSTAPTITGAVSGELLTCPDDCIEGLTDMIESADEEILLSLQYFEMDWYWGWGENPLTDALHDAAVRGVSIRLIINQHYVNENSEIREAVNDLNEEWGVNQGLDVEAILMSENDTVRKLHNKGVIVDGESVLISSINWGDNSILRNREMGLILHSEAITAPYLESWWDDWNRLDSQTDTDLDGLPDSWEIANGLARSRTGDAQLDPDGDGVDNTGEYSYGSNPLSNDTDGDCILDGIEILWAATQSGVNATSALTMADADGDGEDDYITFGCVPVEPEDPVDNNTDNGTENPGNNTEEPNVDADTDSDGIKDSIDDCPGTLAGAATDTQGCSNQQNKQLNSDETSTKGDSPGLSFMLYLVGGGILILLSAGAILMLKSKGEEEHQSNFVDIPDESKSWDLPILDASSTSDGPDMSRFSRWTEKQVNDYLENGWTEDQLSEWYNQQMEQNPA